MPSQHGAEMPNDHQTFVVINVVKSSASNEPEKRQRLAHFKKQQLVKKGPIRGLNVTR